MMQSSTESNDYDIYHFLQFKMLHLWTQLYMISPDDAVTFHSPLLLKAGKCYHLTNWQH